MSVAPIISGLSGERDRPGCTRRRPAGGNLLSKPDPLLGAVESLSLKIGVLFFLRFSVDSVAAAGSGSFRALEKRALHIRARSAASCIAATGVF